MKQFKTFLQEAIELEYHQELNSSLWKKEGEDNYILKPEIEKKLTDIADEWRKFAKIPKEAVLDIILTGGNANFNWTKYSDIDLHIVINKELLLPSPQWNTPFAHNNAISSIINDYLRSKKQLWSLKHNIKIAELPVEVYAQGHEELYHENQGVYSILQHKWIYKPIRGNYDFNNKELDHKVEMWEKRINNAIMGNATSEEIYNIRKRLSNMRKSAIEKSGEFASENLVFKALRNSGYLQRLVSYQRTMFDRSFSI